MPMISTTYPVVGLNSPADARAIKEALVLIPQLGAIATEIVPGGPSVIVLKHKDDVTPDRAAIDAALRDAGDFHLA